ncbi:hypothetical protein OESDEN_19115, partial [Oesophagostomum dentatum]
SSIHDLRRLRKTSSNAILGRTLRKTGSTSIFRSSIYRFYSGVYGKRSVPVSDSYDDERQQLPFYAGWSKKRAVMPFSGGLYGKRGTVLPFSGGLYGKRVAMPFSGGLYGKRSDRYIRSPMPISGGFFG